MTATTQRRQGARRLLGISTVMITAALSACGGSDGDAVPVAQIPAPVGTAVPIDLSAPLPVAAATADTPDAAVTTFLDARMAGDATGSLAILADLERSAYVTVEEWELRSEGLPEVTGYTLRQTNGTTVTVEATLVPRLDASAGFRPEHAVMTWETVAEGGGYRVSLAGTRLEPTLPDAAGATTAALDWVASAQACAPAGQYAGNLLGDPLVVEALCGTELRFEAGSTEPLTAFVDPASIQASLGADAALFTRVVRLDGGGGLDVVVAPLGNQWQVVGVAPVP